MENANPVTIPADIHQETCEATYSGGKEIINAPYRQAIGSLMYLFVATRPDITFAVNKTSRHLQEPKKAHWNTVKRILKYLKGTSRYGLYFKCGSDSKILVYSDADYAGDTETRRSTTGYVLKLIDNHMELTATKSGYIINNGGRVRRSLPSSQGAELGEEIVS